MVFMVTKQKSKHIKVNETVNLLAYSTNYTLSFRPRIFHRYTTMAADVGTGKSSWIIHSLRFFLADAAFVAVFSKIRILCRHFGNHQI